jgi:hypothetical protein
MSFHDAVLYRLVWDEQRVVSIELREVPDLGRVVIRITGSTGILSGGTFEPDWFLSDVVFLSASGVQSPPWTGRRDMWRTLVLATNGAYLEVVGGGAEILVGEESIAAGK